MVIYHLMPPLLPAAVPPKYRQLLSAIENDIVSGRFGPGQRLPTEAEYGKRFGVSRITVGRALQELQHQGVVLRRAGSGTYVAEAKLSERASLLFGALVPNLGELEIFGPICQGISERLQAQRHGLLWGYTAPSSEAKTTGTLDLCDQYIARRVAGVFFAPVEWTGANHRTNADVLSALERAGIPIVLLDRCVRPFPDRCAHDLVGIDHRRVGYRLTQHLLDLGCRRVAFVAYAESAPTVEYRVAGYREALFQAGVPAHPEWVRRLQRGEAEELHDLMQTVRPEAIFCANDRTAGHVMHRLLGLGYRIPDDVRIVGVDDVGYANLLPVPLTTVRQPCREIGVVAAEAMLGRVADPGGPVRDIMLDFELVVRVSCGAPVAALASGRRLA